MFLPFANIHGWQLPADVPGRIPASDLKNGFRGTFWRDGMADKESQCGAACEGAQPERDD